ncbi:MAG: GatB/YqeY domain-containing protein [Candidatus Paceibacterota bacterium]
MALHEEIKASLKDALKARDEVKLRTVRSMLTAFTNELVATGRMPQDTLTDEEVLHVIKKLANQRKDSIQQYEAANRPELAIPEKEELVILESYLPQMMSQEEIEPIVKAKIAELEITDKSKMGILIGAVLKETKGQADGKDVKAVVEKLLT